MVLGLRALGFMALGIQEFLGFMVLGLQGFTA